ncbi:MAG: nicotinate phosphoribosyltransferase [Spirochaetes bacterium GWD1_27_9]|nr:MAG: nicotinate phosphoribosyltransferase [Spirochaetes bacterium GWB1_27_13]OHD24857.1 MAG: nicotinate phosphoribosyltransferase [Spirochaetes bacterium GWC1_27_15]OHD31094.1 MAG: nicotinate phosphoribosyltransferase [Spirochaetes bacterium GWD1_27_9]OHD79825.1 MAG: nicotinate phosphoribosyltransferase [Spirochaetes bacterium RIFOXYB1_FULL_32_8]
MIINSLLDTDLYKLTMQQAVLHKFPASEVEFKFKCRNKDIDLRRLSTKIKEEIRHLCSLRFTNEELDYLRSIRFIKKDYVDFLRIFQLNEEYIHIKDDTEFSLKIAGPWLHTILFEVPVLAIINELYFKSLNYDEAECFKIGSANLSQKIELVKKTNDEDLNFRLIEFGTRRRFSFKWHNIIVETLKKELPKNFSGTSNVYFAMKNNLIPFGTMAHEWLQAGQALGVRLVDSQKFMLENWVSEYRGDLGIALSDVVGMEAFLRDFDLYFTKLFDGARHDSGDPYLWCDKLIEHYHSLGIDPSKKSAVFSDGLTFPLAINLAKKYKGKINTSFGIGTNLTNDVGLDALQIVIKMTKCNGQPVAKISDSSGKGMCEDDGYLNYLKQVFKII